MADEQLPLIRVHGFKSTYERLPVKGDPMHDDVDLKGYKIDAKGNRIIELQEEYWVKYSPAHSPLNTMNEERIRHIMPDRERIGDDPDGVKYRFMAARWSQIEPHYEAFKAGRTDVAVDGTPLGAWPGLIQEQVEILRQSGIRTVEEVAKLIDSQLDKVRLPNMRDLRKQAQLFLENSTAAVAAEREAKMEAKLAAVEEQLQAAMELLEQQASKEAPRRGRPPKVAEDEEEAA